MLPSFGKASPVQHGGPSTDATVETACPVTGLEPCNGHWLVHCNLSPVALHSPRARGQLPGRTEAVIALLLSAAASSCSRHIEPSAEQARRAGRGSPATVRYALDDLQRKKYAGKCPKVALTEFAGQNLRFLPPAHVNSAFRAHLVQFESIVREVALRIYDREPTAILVAASYDCRNINGSKGRLSEHALGNAIDVAGFRFPPLPGSVLRSAQDGFDVRIARHWKAHWGWQERRHARFLDELTRTLIERDVFRTLLGPAHPDHKDHFHFDMAPGHYVDL